MKRYEGQLDADGEGAVYVTDGNGKQPLRNRCDLRGYKTGTGFSWGYTGSGPLDLAASLLADALGDEIAQAWFERFLQEKLATVPQDNPWVMTDAEIREWFESVSAGWTKPIRN